MELKRDEKLPQNFIPLHPHTGRYCGYACECLHFEYADLNLKTMEYLPDDPRKEEETPGYRVISETDGEILIDYDGVKITLPVSANIESIEVKVAKDMVVLEGDTTTYIFPRNNCHYKHLLLEHGQDMTTFLLGDIYVKKESPPDQRYRFSYHLFDPHTKQFVQYARDSYSKPVASYNGLVWWIVNQRSLIPTFMDLSNPDKYYIRKDRILTVAKDSNDDPLDDEMPEGFVREGDNRFITRSTESSNFQAIDLDSATVNTVEVPRNDGAENLFLGYMNDKFHARYVRDSTRDKYMEQSYEYKYTFMH